MNTNNKKCLLLVDGSSYLYRAFHALPPLTNSHGDPTGAVFGVVNMLQKTLAEYHPDYVAVVFDAKGKTFRHEWYAEYKATRPPMPDDLRVQIGPLHDFVKALGLPLFEVSGVEADDVIGTLAVQAENAGIHTIISTGDKDMAQLVNDRIALVNTMSNTSMDADGVKAKFGVTPEHIIDYLALIGDSSDNVPGVPKVGPKTAVKWLDEYGSLDAIMQHADEFKGKVGDNLRATLEQLPLSRDLVTIRTDVELDRSPVDLVRTPVEVKQLESLLGLLEFSGGIEQFTNNTETAAPVASVQYETVLDKKVFLNWLQRLKQSDLFAFDTETDALDYMRASIVGVSFAINANEAAYVPLAHDYPGAPAQLDRDWALEQLKPLLEDPEQYKVGQHLKYDMNVLANHGITLRGVKHDTMLESYVFNSVATRHDMDSLAKKYLGVTTIHYEDVAGKGAKQLTFNEVPLEEATPYAAEDADITLKLHQQLYPQLATESRLLSVLNDIEIPLIPVLSSMERGGVLVDVDSLHQQSQELAERMMELEQQAHETAHQTFNLGSPKQLQEVLFEKLKLP
ncbi:MAG: DNA polymerase I, partial [Gammaproteobacteria bacterium]